MHKTIAFIVGATLMALCLPGCAQVQAPTGTQIASAAPAAPQGPSDPIGQLAAFTVSDLQAASADAKAQTPPDTTASQCYDFLAGVIPTLQPPTPGNIKLGAFIAFQKARDLANGTTSNSGFLKQLNIACAPLVFDANLTLARLGLVSAGTAATGGALAPFAGALGPIGAALPIPIP